VFHNNYAHFFSSGERLCVAGCGHVEDAQHLFLSCNTFSFLWPLVRLWIGFEWADTHVISDHFSQFTLYTCGLKLRRSFFQLIWLICVWVVWNERNNMLFKLKENTIFQLLKKVKLYSLWWLKVKKTNFIFGTHMWWSSLLLCLGII